MKKVIGYSLWGNSIMHTYGAIENAHLGKRLFPDWTIRYYYNDTVPNKIIDHLRQLDNVELIEKETGYTYENLKWRFEGMWDPTVDVYVCRDADARLDDRDNACIYDWLENSDAKFMTIREAGGKGAYIGGGMFAFRDHVLDLPALKNTFESGKYFAPSYYYKKTGKLTDQHFLDREVLPIIKNTMIVYLGELDSFYKRHPHETNDIVRKIPIPQKGYDYLGSRIKHFRIACEKLGEDHKAIVQKVKLQRGRVENEKGWKINDEL